MAYSDIIDQMPLEKFSPHVAVLELNNGMTAFSRVCEDYSKANHVRQVLMLEYEGQGLRVKESYTIPLIELPRIYPQFRNKTLPQITKMLKGFEDVKYGRKIPKKKTRMEMHPFGL